MVFVSIATPAFATAYGWTGNARAAFRPRTEPMLTIEPPPWRCMCGMTAREKRNTPLRTTSSTPSQEARAFSVRQRHLAVGVHEVGARNDTESVERHRQP